MPYIKANGIRIAYDTYGDMKNPPLFMTHGLYGSRRSFDVWAERFSKYFFVITYDCRGHGQSDKPAYFTLSDHGRDLLALIDAFGYEQAAVYGVSMGSYVTLQAAALDSSKISRLVLVVTKGYGKTSSFSAKLKEMGIDPYDVPIEQLQGGTATNEALWCPETPMEVRELEEKTAPAITSSGAERKAIDTALLGFDLRPGCPFVSCPTLICQGRHDGLNPVEGGQELAELIPNAELRIFEHSGHLVYVEEPELLYKTVVEFLCKKD